MSNKTFQLTPYLMFGGNCEEALNFYHAIIGGEVVIVNRYDNPAMQAPEDYKDKVLHAQLKVGNEIVLYASDTFPGSSVQHHSGDVSLSIVFRDDLEKAKQAYSALAAGGKAGLPFEKQFWGDWHGNLQDRYGIKWNINFEG